MPSASWYLYPFISIQMRISLTLKLMKPITGNIDVKAGISDNVFLLKQCKFSLFLSLDCFSFRYFFSLWLSFVEKKNFLKRNQSIPC